MNTYQKISMKCTARAIRMITDEDYMNFINFLFNDFELTRKIYGAWWNFLKEAGVDTKQLLNTDYTPVRFLLKNVQCHNSSGVNNGIFTQTHYSRKIKGTWQEKLWCGEFNLEISFQKIPGLEKVIKAFINNLKQGLVTLGGGKSIGRGIVETDGADVPAVEMGKLRCPKGHFTSKQKFCFGGECKCGTIVVPQ